MLDRETVLALFEASAQSLLFNLDFFPAGKLNWKPAPEAKSALEIVNHLTEFLSTVSRSLKPEQDVWTPATNGNEAKLLLAAVAEKYVALVRGASASTLSEKFREDMPLTKGWIVTAGVIDTVHHSGQIAYLQTLLGDTEIHYDESALPDFAIG